ncbi:helix-turn-helix domain-containing protein [Chryseobacterium paludis]|uniref:helix-turn-helix domain-containing protein n=1 Tax=Chryseobacterium paludis TaxID=2956784 RepID=UPI0021C01F4B|nr:response regulator transcription factor [Chryseobacterium paludis]
MKHYKSLIDLHRTNGFKLPENPQLSLLECDKTCFIEDTEFTTDFYIIGLKKIASGVIRYGRTNYDHENGSMYFIKPRQVVSMNNLELEEEGFMMIIHEDFLNGHPLQQKIRSYNFFEYQTNEALHLSPKEEQVIWELYKKIEQEYDNNQDEYSQDIMLGYIESILKFSQRFYKRQFINRNQLSGHLCNKFDSMLYSFFSDGTEGLPTVKLMADKLNVSARYLTDVLKQETGKTAIEHIHLYLVSEAKNRLILNNSSIAEIAYQLGFENPPYFTRLFKKEVGITPKEFRKIGFN